MSNAKENTDIEKFSFEDALGELENIVKRLDEGGQNLDASIKDYTRGTALKTHCEKKLSEAKLKVEKIVNDGDSKSTAPLDIE
jgi:exodeoxyribonuclease VII small subunit